MTLFFVGSILCCFCFFVCVSIKVIKFMFFLFPEINILYHHSATGNMYAVRE